MRCCRVSQSAFARFGSRVLFAVLFASALLVSAGVAPALAAPVTFEFEATIYTVIDPLSLLGGTIATGDTFTGRYVFDASTPDANPDPMIGSYQSTSPTSGLGFDLGGFSFRTDPANAETEVGVIDDPARDAYGMRSSNNVAPAPGLFLFSFLFVLLDPTGTALTSDALLLDPPDLSSFEYRPALYLAGRRDGEPGAPIERLFQINAFVTSLKEVPYEPEPQPVPAPEPGTLVLLVTGALGLVARRRSIRG